MRITKPWAIAGNTSSCALQQSVRCDLRRYLPMGLSTSGGVVRRYVGARQMSAPPDNTHDDGHTNLFRQPVRVRLLELRNTYKWGGGPDKTILLSAEQHDRTLVDVVVAYIRDVRDREFCITDKARARGLTFYEI